MATKAAPLTGAAISAFQANVSGTIRRGEAPRGAGRGGTRGGRGRKRAAAATLAQKRRKTSTGSDTASGSDLPLGKVESKRFV